jgi:hypothetical protein
MKFDLHSTHLIPILTKQPSVYFHKAPFYQSHQILQEWIQIFSAEDVQTALRDNPDFERI